MHRHEVRKLFLIIENTYPIFEHDDVKVDIWMDLLHDFPFDKAQQNLRKHTLNNKYPPTPAEIRGSADPEVFVDFEQQKLDTKKRLQEHDELLLKVVPPPGRLPDGER